MPRPIPRMRIVARPGRDRFAGPTRAERFRSRWLPLVIPLVLQVLALAGLSLPALAFLIVSLGLFLSARTWLLTGDGLLILVLVQLAGGAAAILLYGFNFLDPADWMVYSGATALLMGYVAWFFNLVASFLPR